MIDINSAFSLKERHIDFYQKNRYIKIKDILSPTTISHFNDLISKKVDQLNVNPKPLDEKDTYGKAFVQMTNLWAKDKDIQELVFSKRIAQIASDLMQVDGVRLYHDQALFKEAGGGITPWHADQYYWPLSSDKTITAWIPLQSTPIEMGPLEFSASSHLIKEGRDLMIGDESESLIGDRLKVTDFEHIVEPFELGEISFHSGWVFHRAGANSTSQVRKVITVIYMDKDMKLKEPTNKNQIDDWHTWCPGAMIGEVIDTDLNPILFSR